MPQRAVQRANAIVYVREENLGDIAEGLKNYSGIKKGVQLLQENGPSGLPLRSVALSSLPDLVQRQINDVRNAGPTDPRELYKLGFRDFHLNRGGHLPENDPSPSNNKNQQQAAYYNAANSGEYGRDQRGYVAQYAEFHLTQSGLGKAFRLLYDYMSDIFYITITHYNIWNIYSGSGDANPFFRVV